MSSTVSDNTILDTLNSLSQVSDSLFFGSSLRSDLKTVSNIRLLFDKTLETAAYCYSCCLSISNPMYEPKIIINNLRDVLLAIPNKTLSILNQMETSKLRTISIGLKTLQAQYAGSSYLADIELDKDGFKIPIYREIQKDCLESIIDLVEAILLERALKLYVDLKKRS
jgi:hypothetical protein